MSGTRRRYTSEFKAEAVRLVASSGQPVSQIARELGINEQTLHNWKRQATAADGSGVVPGHAAGSDLSLGSGITVRIR